MSNQIEIVFKEELRGRNALHFWIGVAAFVVGIYLWWNGLFSGMAVEMGLAPESLKDSFGARQGVGSTTDGLGSTGAISMVFDTFCLIGWISLAVFGFMRKALLGLMERIGYMSGGLYEWASASNSANPSANDASPSPATKISPIEERLIRTVRNLDKRLKTLEAKTSDIPDPVPPPPPKTLEEMVAEQAAMIEELKLRFSNEKAKPSIAPESSPATPAIPPATPTPEATK